MAQAGWVVKKQVTRTIKNNHRRSHRKHRRKEYYIESRDQFVSSKNFLVSLLEPSADGTSGVGGEKNK